MSLKYEPASEPLHISVKWDQGRVLSFVFVRLVFFLAYPIDFMNTQNKAMLEELEQTSRGRAERAARERRRPGPHL